MKHIDKGHWTVKRLFKIIEENKITVKGMCDDAGLPTMTIYRWRMTASPLVINIEACLNSIGYEFQIVRIKGWQKKDHQK